MEILIAPMAGYTDYSYRQILKDFKPDLMYCEMINSTLLKQKNTNTINRLLRMSEGEPTGVQLFGGDINDLYHNFKYLHERGYRHLLINMGCPQPKIVKNGAGANMLPRFEEIKELLTALTKENIPVSMKIRHSENTNKYFELANKLKLPYICIHPRTREQLFTGKADWTVLKELSKYDRDTKLIGNGDIFSLNDYKKVKHINMDGIMLARGIISNPYLIQEIREGKEVDNKDNISLCLRHMDLLKEDKGEGKAVIEINKFIIEYFKGVDVREILRIRDFEEKKKRIRTIRG